MSAPVLEQALIVAGAAIFGVLGALHLVYTFVGRGFEARDAATVAAMQSTSPRLTRRTTMWKAWVGFNASHSLGALLFAALIGGLAIDQMALLRTSPMFVWVAVAGATAYLALAVRYWFRTPLVGIALATACFAIAAARMT